MEYSNNIIFGPIPSRRFGISLGIDLSPTKKQCNFDCLYCELEAAKTVDKMVEYPKVQEVLKALEDSFRKYQKIDVITLTANGEPTLYPYLSKLITQINKIKKNAKTLILSNGSTIYNKEIFNALLKVDTVKLSLDCVSNKCFKKLDRNHKNIQIDKIIPAMCEFSQKTKNNFVLEILFVKTLNDKEEELKLLYEAIKKINPQRVDIGTIDRPPAYNVKPVEFQFLQNVAEFFKGINTNIVYKNRPNQINSYTKDEILVMLKRRPLTKEDIDNMFDKSSTKLLEKLLEKGLIKKILLSGVEFYKNI